MGLTNTETKSTSFERDMNLERKFERQLKAILGNQFIGKEVVADLREGTDFAIFNIRPFRVGVRLRRYKYYNNLKYRKEFTIRYSRPSGVETEIDKIKKGLVGYILYGFVDQDEQRIIQYFIGDLEVFNRVSPDPYEIRENYSHDSKLAIYKIDQLTDDFVVKFWHQ